MNAEAVSTAGRTTTDRTDADVAAATRAARIEAVCAARRQVMFEPTPVRAEWLVDVAWRPERYAWLAELTEGSALETVAGWPWIEWLINAAEDAAIAGADWAEAEPWLRLLAGASDAKAADALGDAIGHWNRVVTWWAGVPADVAAVAWAAGLVPSEVQAQMAAGTLDVNALRALVVLRGWRLPEAETARTTQHS